MRNWLATFQIILAGVCFGFLGIFGRLAYQAGLQVGELLTFRFVLAAFLLLVGVAIFDRKLLILNGRQILVSFGLGALGYAVFSNLYFNSIKGVSVPLAAMLLFSFPVFVSLGAHFFLKEKMNRPQVLALALSMVGLVLLVWGDVEVKSWVAVFYGLGAAVTYSVYVLVSSKMQKNVNPFTSSVYVISSAAITLPAVNQPSLEFTLSLNKNQWLVILGIAVVCTITPIILFLAGLQKMSSSKASILVMVEPVVASLAASLILNEMLVPIQMIGAALVLSGVFIDARSK